MSCGLHKPHSAAQSKLSSALSKKWCLECTLWQQTAHKTCQHLGQDTKQWYCEDKKCTDRAHFVVGSQNEPTVAIWHAYIEGLVEPGISHSCLQDQQDLYMRLSHPEIPAPPCQRVCLADSCLLPWQKANWQMHLHATPC